MNETSETTMTIAEKKWFQAVAALKRHVNDFDESTANRRATLEFADLLERFVCAFRLSVARHEAEIIASLRTMKDAQEYLHEIRATEAAELLLKAGKWIRENPGEFDFDEEHDKAGA